MRENRYAYRILTGKPKGKRPCGRPGCRWEDETTIDFKGIGRRSRMDQNFMVKNRYEGRTFVYMILNNQVS
jgi:hypothetical protein